MVNFKKNLYFIGITTTIIFIFIALIFFLKIQARSNTFLATITDFEDGKILTLSSGKKIDLAGLYIPYEGPNYSNYRKELIDFVENLLVGKEILVKIIAHPRQDYPKYDLAVVFFKNGLNVNEYLVREGKAFFDHGYYRNKKRYEQLEYFAKINKKGIWANKENLQVQFIGSKKWRFYHFPDCPKVKKIVAKDKIEYYFRPSDITWFRYLATYECKFCHKKAISLVGKIEDVGKIEEK